MAYIELKNLDVYKLARELSKQGWEIYRNLNWQDKKIMGDQFIESVDSIGANIAEGYGRFHYLDRIKFYYNGRGSFNEAVFHWLELILEREKVSKEQYSQMKLVSKRLSLKLNNFIHSTYTTRNNQQSDDKM